MGLNPPKHLKPYAYVSEIDWTVDVSQLHADFCARAGIMPQVLASVLPRSNAHHLYDRVQGHDLLRIIDIGLKGFLRGVRSCGEHELRSKLRIAVRDSQLAASTMCMVLEQMAAAYRLPRLMAS